MIRCLLVLLILFQFCPVPVLADVFDEGEEQPSPQGPVPRYEPDREALRSVILPGWSQHRQGASEAGWAFSAIAFTTFIFMIGIVEVPVLGDEDDNFGQVLAGALYGMNAVVSGWDAYNRAVESNRENGWDLHGQARSSGVGFRLPLVRTSF
jgi:hypothetical protein